MFGGLDAQEEYYPMVARSGRRTFFAHPPQPIVPRSEENKLLVRNIAEPQVNASDESGEDDPPSRLSSAESSSSSSEDDMDLDSDYKDVSDDDTVEVINNDSDRRRISTRLSSNTVREISVGHDINPPSNGSQSAESQADTDDWEAWQKDNKIWDEWYATDLPKIADGIFYRPPQKSDCNVSCCFHMFAQP